MDTLLAVARTVEILSIELDPVAALSLDMQQSSLPQGISQQASVLGQTAAVGISVSSVKCTAISQEEIKCSDVSKNATELSAQQQIDAVIEKNQALVDEEEAEDTLGLKKLFAIMLKAVLPANSAYEDQLSLHIEDIIARFNYNGCALAEYHSTRKGVLLNKVDPYNPFIDENNRVLDCDNALDFCSKVSALAKKELDKMLAHDDKSAECILFKIHRQLVGKNLSFKAAKTWNIIVEELTAQARTKNDFRLMRDPTRVIEGAAEKIKHLRQELLDLSHEPAFTLEQGASSVQVYMV